MTASVYWIRHKDHTDMFSQGYIGVSTDIKRRWADHQSGTNSKILQNAIKKYGWDNLIKEVILLSKEKFCYEIEYKLRKTPLIGWNLVIGGGKPPDQTGKKRSNDTCIKISEARNKKEAKEHLQQNHPLKKPCRINGKYYISLAKAVRDLNINRITLLRWLNKPECKRKTKYSHIKECEWIK